MITHDRVRALKYTAILLLKEFNTEIEIVLNVIWVMTKEIDVFEYISDWTLSTNLRTQYITDTLNQLLIFKSLENHRLWWKHQGNDVSIGEHIRAQNLNITVLCVIRKLEDAELFVGIRTKGEFEQYIGELKLLHENAFFETIEPNQQLKQISQFEFWTKLFGILDKFIKL